MTERLSYPVLLVARIAKKEIIGHNFQLTILTNREHQDGSDLEWRVITNDLTMAEFAALEKWVSSDSAKYVIVITDDTTIYSAQYMRELPVLTGEIVQPVC